MTFPRRFARAILRYRVAVLAITALATLAAALQAPRVEFQASTEMWFVEGDPHLARYHQFLAEFQTDEILLVALTVDDVFRPEHLALIDRLTEQVATFPYVQAATSLTNLDVLRADDEEIRVGPLVPDLPATQAEAEPIRAHLAASPLLRDALVSADHRTAAILIELVPIGTTLDAKIALVHRLERALAAERGPGVELEIAGAPAFDVAFDDRTNRDVRRLVPPMVAIVLLSALVLFRRLALAMIPFLTVVIAIIWTIGLLVTLGFTLNVVSSALFVLILGVGVADSIHILTDYTHQLAHHPKAEALEEALTLLLRPCLLTSITTVAGLLSLATSALAPIREFGFLAAFGVAAAFLLSITFVPAALSFLKPPDPAFLERQRTGLITHLLERLASPTRPFRAVVLVLAGVLAVASLALLPRIETSANPVRFLPPEDPVRQSTVAVDQQLGGTGTLELVVEAPEEGLKDPAVLRRLDDLQAWLAERPGVGSVVSIVDQVKEFQRLAAGGAPEAYQLPDTTEAVAQTYLLMEFEGANLDSLVLENYSKARMTARIRLSEADLVAEQFRALEDRIRADFPATGSLHVEPTGTLNLIHRMEEYVLETQVESFLLALVVISALMGLLLRSAKLGALALIPNLTPILFAVPVMVLAKIPLNPGTAMCASIALGLIVDDTVHVLSRLQAGLAVGRSTAEAVRATVIESGRPIVVTSALLGAGFVVLTQASFAPIVHLGALTAAIVVLALLADLVLLPALLLFARSTSS